MSSSNPTIVLVHGEGGDPTDWYPVASLLERVGFTVSVPSLPLTSLEDDTAAVRRIFAAQTAGIVAVGHAYGGAIITGAAAGNPQVVALVYVAAYAPDRGESIDDLVRRIRHRSTTVLSPGGSRLSLALNRPRRGELFPRGSSAHETNVPKRTQPAISLSARFARIVQPAWREMPSWYLVATDDRSIPVRLQRYMAKRLAAIRTIEVETGHSPQLAQPAAVASFIQEAADHEQ